MQRYHRGTQEGCKFYARMKDCFITANVRKLRDYATGSGIQNQTPFVARLRKREARVIRVQRICYEYLMPREAISNTVARSRISLLPFTIKRRLR